jgi:hypothetical protein
VALQEVSKVLEETVDLMIKTVLPEDRAQRIMDRVLPNLRVLQVPLKLLFLIKTATKVLASLLLQLVCRRHYTVVYPQELQVLTRIV